MALVAAYLYSGTNLNYIKAVLFRYSLPFLLYITVPVLISRKPTPADEP